MSSKQNVICVLGMHRSGTSVVSKMLSLLGAYLGPEHRTMLPTAANPKGFWEHTGFVDINDEILTRFGGDWHNPPEFPEEWANSPAVGDLRKRAAEIIDREFGDASVWSWKDPRTCLTIPFWQQLLPDMQYVICVRDPVAVARSLEKRDGFSVEKSGRLWLTHTASALRWTSARPRLVVCYEEIMQNCEPEVRRVAAFLNAAERLHPQLLDDIRAFVDDSLYHHRPRLAGSVDEPSMIFPAKSLYLALRGSASRSIGEKSKDLDAALDAYASLALEEHAAQVRSVARTTVIARELTEVRQQVEALALDERTPEKRPAARTEDIVRHELIASELRVRLVDQSEQRRGLARRNEHLTARVESAGRVTARVRSALRRVRTENDPEASGPLAAASRFFGRSKQMSRALGVLSRSVTLGTCKCLLQLVAQPGRLHDAYVIAASGAFDENYYLRRNPDVAASRMRPLMHFILNGEAEGRQPHPLFDTRWYLSMWPDVGRTSRSVFVHFLLHGSHEGRDPHPLFSLAFYRAGLNGLRPLNANPFIDYLMCGADEGRATHPLFDSAYYLEENPDVAAAGIDPLAHFTHFGAFEGRNPHPLFDVRFYLSQNREVAAAGVNPLVHYWYGVGSERRSPHPLFHAPYYLSTNPEVQRIGGEPLSHFLAAGAARGRNPNPFFDCSYYAAQVPEVAAGRVNALVHFVREGWQTGMNPSSDFDTAAYLRDHADVREWGGNPLVHYIHFGRSEGRIARVVGTRPDAPVWPWPHDATESIGSFVDTASRVAGSRFAVYSSSLGSWSGDAMANLLTGGLEDLGLAVEQRDERQGFSDAAEWHIVVAPHQFFYLGAGPDLLRRGTPPQLILLNTEEPSTPSFSLSLACFSRACAVWDISNESARVIGTKGYRASYLPLGYSPRFAGGREVLLLPETPATAFLEPEALAWASSNPRRQRPIDVLFVGQASSRRSRFFARAAAVLSQYRCCLHLSGPAPAGTVRSSDVDTATFAGLAQRSKIVLNVHHGADPSFEWARIVLGGLWQKSLVISEPCSSAPPFKPGVDFLEAPIDGLASTIDYVLSNPDGQANADRIAEQGFATLTRECVLADALQRVILDLHALPDDARKMAPAVASRNPSTGFAAAGRNTSQAED